MTRRTSAKGAAIAGAFTPEFLRTHRDEIIVEWERGAVIEEGAAKLTPLALRDEMPAFVDELAAWLSSVEEASSSRMRAVSTHHALQRLDSSLDLAQLVSEFRVLRAVILEMLLAAEAAEQERSDLSQSHPPTRAARDRAERVLDLARLNSGLDFAIGHVVESRRATSVPPGARS